MLIKGPVTLHNFLSNLSRNANFEMKIFFNISVKYQFSSNLLLNLTRLYNVQWYDPK